MKTANPRVACYFGMRTEAHVNPNGTWLEPEELTYPSGAMIRRCRALCEDGKIRVVICGMPDTLFSIPARARIGGKSVRGYVTSDESGYLFRAYTN